MKNAMISTGIKTTLPRVEDLEHSVQWTNLANDIDDLEKFRRRNKPINLTYQRSSMPELQETNKKVSLQRETNCFQAEHPRWSWKPKTDFERDYFYKDYKDYCQSQDYHPKDKKHLHEKIRHHGESSVERSSGGYHSQEYKKEHFSDSRERLHEIFEHNRYLRRQFFAGPHENIRENRNKSPRNLVKANQEALRHYTGFGSTETLASQSNQSSVSSVNDRKSRTQTSHSPEEEEDVLTELVQRKNKSPQKRFNIDSRFNRRNEIQQDGKVLVNILPGSEVKRVDVKNVPVKLNEANNEPGSSNKGLPIVEKTQFRDTTSVNDKKMLDTPNQQNDLENKTDHVRYRTKNFPTHESTKQRNSFHNYSANDPDIDNRSSHLFSQTKNNTRTCTLITNDNNQLKTANDSILNRSNNSISYQDFRNSLPNLTISRQNVDRPLYANRVVNMSDSTAQHISSGLLNYKFNSSNVDPKQSQEERSRQCKEQAILTDNENRIKSSSYKQSTEKPICHKQLILKKSKIPPPLDLSMVNEYYEQIEANERKHLNDYTVDVTILSKQEDCIKDIVDTNILPKNDDNSSNESSYQTDDRRRQLSYRYLHKSCDELSMTDELLSPQLVNNYKNSTGDLRTTDPTVGIRRRPIDPDAFYHDGATSPLFDQMSPVGGHQTGSALPSIYGPIPYKSPRRYVEGEVTIHYRSPVRAEAKEPLSEEELARRSAENMRRLYQEERRRKYLQELHDIDSRRHTDNFIPSQKSPISLNRYDDFVDDLSLRSRSQDQTPEPRLIARALYNFVGQSSRELTFRRGDIIFVRRQVDKNWYEGEYNAMIGLFPFNYVEILPYDGMTRTTPRRAHEGQARAKFNFIAQTNLELSLAKGELVVLTRKIDENWYEGRVGNRKGIFPISYVEVITEPGHRSETPIQNKPIASPAAHSLLTNGSSGGKMSMGPHHYVPSISNISTTQPHYNSLPRMGGSKLHISQLNETLHIDTHSEPTPYRALYNYKPQNEDELELKEGDRVYVMEKCDDGWYVGSSQRTGYFGTFPGNYVEKL